MCEPKFSDSPFDLKNHIKICLVPWGVLLISSFIQWIELLVYTIKIIYLLFCHDVHILTLVKMIFFIFPRAKCCWNCFLQWRRYVQNIFFLFLKVTSIVPFNWVSMQCVQHVLRRIFRIFFQWLVYCPKFMYVFELCEWIISAQPVSTIGVNMTKQLERCFYDIAIGWLPNSNQLAVTTVAT